MKISINIYIRLFFFFLEKIIQAESETMLIVISENIYIVTKIL